MILVREPLELLRVDAIGYGAKDTGEMGGGAAAAVLAGAGEEIVTELCAELARTSRSVGEVAVTGAYGLRASGVRWVLHIVSIIKNTAEGAWCPHPARLADGVHAALAAADGLGARSVALSALGTGEGRVKPEDAARHMFDGVRAFRRSMPRSEMELTFSLPSDRDYRAFSKVLAQSS